MRCPTLIAITIAAALIAGTAGANDWNAVMDPSFEEGGPGNPYWNEDSLNELQVVVYEPAFAHTGQWFATFGLDTPMTELASLSQEIELGDFEAELSFKLKRYKSSNNGSDTIRVLVDGVEVFSETVLGGATEYDWTLIGPIDLNSFADGNLHTLEFTFEQMSFSQTGYGTVYHLDDVAVWTGNTPVVADFSWSPVNAQVGEQVFFQDESTGGVDQWVWEIDGAPFANVPDPSIAFSDGGEYQVKLIVTRTSDGASDWIKQSVFIEGPLTADFGWEPESPQPGEVVHFFEQASGGPSWWTWSMPDGTILEGPEQNWVFEAAGAYQVTLTVGHDQEPDDTATITKTVTVGTTLDAEFAWAPESPRVGETVSFLDQSTGEPNRWYWEFGDGATSRAQNPDHVFTEPGLYRVDLTVVRNNDNATSFVSHDIQVLPGAVEADFEWAPEFPTVGQEVHFRDLSRGDPGAWLWAFGDDTVSEEQNPVHVFEAPGIYPVTLTVIGSAAGGANAEPSSITYQVSVGGDELSAWFGWDPELPAANDTIQFIDESNGEPSRWLWEFGDGATSDEQFPDHVYDEPGLYNVTLTVGTDDDQVTNAPVSTVTRRVPVAPAVGLPDFTWEPTTPTVLDGVQFFDLTEGNPIGWDWDFGDGSGSSLRNPLHVFEQPGAYPVTLTVQFGDSTTGGRQATHVVMVLPQLEARFHWAPDVPLVDETVQFFEVSLGNPDGWSWDFGDGQTSDEQYPTHAWAAPGVYPVTLTITRHVNGTPVVSQTTREILVVNDVEVGFGVSPEKPRARQPVEFVPDIHGSGVGGYWWSFGDGNFVEAERPVHVYEFPGFYLVQMVVWKEDGSTVGIAEREIEVLPADQSFEIEVSDRTPDRGDRVHLRLDPAVEVDQVTWDFGGVNCNGDPGPFVCVADAENSCLEAHYRWATHGPKPVRALIQVGDTSYAARTSVTVRTTGTCGGGPAANFSWWPESPRAGQEIRCVDRSTGPPSMWSWRFPDGTVVDEQHPEWVFSMAGEYEVELTVSNDAGSDTVVKTIVVEATENICGDGFCGPGENTWTCRADCGPSEDGESGRTGRKHTNLMVPAAAGSVAGAADSNWFTEGMLFNPNLQDAEVVLEFRPDGGTPSGAPLVAGPIELPARTGLRFDDLLGEAFGTDGVGAVALDATLPIIIDTRTFNQTEVGTLGQSVGAITMDDTVGAGEGEVYLVGLSQNQRFRTNLIFQETTGRNARARVELYDASGELLGTNTVDVAGHGRWQKPITRIADRELDHGSAKVVVEGDGRLAIMASVIDQATNDATSIDAVHPKQVTNAATGAKAEGAEDPHFLVAVVARTPGAQSTLWRSEVSILNPTKNREDLVLEYYQDGGTLQTASVTVKPGATFFTTDVVGDLFPDATNGAGSFHVYSEDAVIVNSRTYNISDVEETVGQSIPGLGSGDMARPGETWLLNNLKDNQEFRCNMGFAEFAGTDSQVTVVLFDNNSMALRYLATKTYTVEAFGSTQINRIFKDMGLTGNYSAVVAYIAVGEDSGAVYSYASVVDNGEGDATTILAKRQ
jgi:PKD repeat protein